MQGYNTYVSDLIYHSQDSLSSLRQDVNRLSNPVSVEIIPELQYELEHLLRVYDEAKVQSSELQAKLKAAQSAAAHANGAAPDAQSSAIIK